MSNNDNHESLFENNDNQIDDDKFSIDIPSQSESPYQDRIPSGYDPMGEIYLRGRAFRGLASGGIPWWILVSGWIIFGGFTLLIIVAVIIAQDFIGLILLFVPGTILLILWRGTKAKLRRRKSKRRF
ncbi:hypothetical protein [Crocosphaera chwakensis]|uniref:Uncharacterized protein n=1 Tax=Crocosphaera chwakensis CCY0110 TaxID=391612 RepID=A3IVM8_9CHRO|nr:hypothetical protein [Crocosphaera chwakensis]EAZ89503.1 hypothetical protein CY0110_01630 [Crocosphaera chwakensis CCY0110]